MDPTMLMMAEAQEAGRLAEAPNEGTHCLGRCGCASACGGPPGHAGAHACWMHFAAQVPAAPVEKCMTVDNDNHCGICGCVTRFKNFDRTGTCAKKECRTAATLWEIKSKEMAPKRMRLTKNIMNPEAGEFWIAYDTPNSCDPGSETYHSM